MNNTHCVLTLSCTDRPGIVAAVANTIAQHNGNITESAQFGDPETNRFFMRVAFLLKNLNDMQHFQNAFSLTAKKLNLNWQLHDLAKRLKVLILASKAGHCLNDLLFRINRQQLKMDLAAIVSNHEVWKQKVLSENIEYIYLPITKDTKKKQEEKLLKIIEEKNIDLIILARYMQVLSNTLATQLAGRIINIHHSFLPSFKGAMPYHQAYERGVKLIGATAHYVTPDLDEGPIIEQDVERVDHAMDVNELTAIGRDIESQVLARAVKLHLEHRILINGQKTVVFR